MRYIPLILMILILASCTSRPDYITYERSETDEQATNNDEPTETIEVEPIDISASGFGGQFLRGGFDYHQISVHSSYDQMIRTFGQPEATSEKIEGTFYDYGYIGFNFPESHQNVEDTSELRVNGIVIFPEDLTKQEVVSRFGWPMEDDVLNFRMNYSHRTSGDHTALFTYDWQDNITEIIFYLGPFAETRMYRDDQANIREIRGIDDDDDD